MSPPSEWPQRRLGELTVRAATWNPKSDSTEHVRYVDVSGVDRVKLCIVAEATYSARDAPSRARKIVQTGDTIFATVRPTLRRIAQVPASLDGEIVSTAFCVLRPNPDQVDPDFLFFATQLDSVMSNIAALETGASYPAVRDSDVLNQIIAVPPLTEQREIASVLNAARSAALHDSDCEAQAAELKRASMRELFTLGLRGEARKETEIGLVPGSWETPALSEVAAILSTRMTYAAFLALPERIGAPGAETVLGIKVADMNSVGPESSIDSAEAAREIWETDLATNCAPPGTIVFPKNGAAVATNKKRRVSHWSVFDPNVMGLIALRSLSQDYLFHWIQSFDLTTITSPGPVPHFNKSELGRVRVPVASIDEQREIVAILDAIDRKIDLHRRKKAVLKELFNTLLHKLMTGEIRVADLDLSALEPRDAAAPALAET
jgi:type I restriction enzyme, S subunit